MKNNSSIIIINKHFENFQLVFLSWDTNGSDYNNSIDMEQDKSKQVEYYFDGQTASDHSSESNPSKERRRAKRVNKFR